MRQAPLVLVLVLAPCAAAPARAEPPAAPDAPEHVAFGLSFKGHRRLPRRASPARPGLGMVGYGPFVPMAPAVVKLWLERKGRKLIANFTMVDAGGESEGAPRAPAHACLSRRSGAAPGWAARVAPLRSQARGSEPAEAGRQVFASAIASVSILGGAQTSQTGGARVY